MISEQTISKFITGNASAEEILAIQEAMQNDANFKKRVDNDRILWENVAFEPFFNTVDSFEQLTKEMMPTKPKRFYLQKSFTRVAAVAAFFIMSVFIIKLLSSESFIQGEVVSTLDSAKKMGLSDGSFATIHPHSSLELDKTFNTSSRRMKLNGNAYFVVKPNKQKTFEVNTDHLKVFVLGTAFSVEENVNETTIKVDHGHVRVEANNEEIHLYAGDALTYNSLSNKSKIFTVGTGVGENFESQFPIVNFTNITLEEIITHLESKHGVGIDFPSRLAFNRYSVQLEGLSFNETLEVLSEISQSNIIKK